MMKSLIKKLLRFFSRRILKKYQPDVIGIAGALGKTSVKDIAVKILNVKFRTAGNLDSHNNQFGLPLSIIGLPTPGKSCWGWCKVWGRVIKLLFKRDTNYPEVLVLEMLAGKPGDLRYLTSIVDCKIGVITTLSSAWLEYFKTLKKLVQELRLMIGRLDKNSYAILNRDEEEIFAMRQKTEADVLTFGFHLESDVRASDMSLKINEAGESVGAYFKISYAGSVVPMYLFGAKKKEDLYPALAAIAIALAMGLNLVEISEVLKEI